MCNEMREKLVECYGRKQMLRRNYASRDNHLRYHCVCRGVNLGRELASELNKCMDLHGFTSASNIYLWDTLRIQKTLVVPVLQPFSTHNNSSLYIYISVPETGKRESCQFA